MSSSPLTLPMGCLIKPDRSLSNVDLQNVRFKAIDAHDIPYPDESINLVTCRTAPHHFHNISKFLSEVLSSSQAVQAYFLLCDTTTSEDAQLAEWHQRVEAIRDPSHVAAPAPSEWRTLIAEAGFEITHSTPTQVDMTFWDWVKRSGSPDDVVEGLHSRLCQRIGRGQDRVRYLQHRR